MRIIVTGKGGTGKTTLAASLGFQLSDLGYRVTLLDADSYPNLAQSLGLPREVSEKLVPLTRNDELIRERTGAAPGDGWGLFFSLTPRVDDLVEKLGVKVNENMQLVVVGGIEEPKEGCMCPAIALAKVFLRHVLLTQRDIVIVDSEAGLEAFGRGLAEYFDTGICVAEPTIKSLDACRKIFSMSEELDVKENILVVNKVKEYSPVEKLLGRVFADIPPFFVAHYDPLVERNEESGLGVENIRNSAFWRDVENVSKYLIRGR
jgi:CO dehydrogenase maturation factor